MQKSVLHFFSKIRFGACLFALLDLASRLLSVCICVKRSNYSRFFLWLLFAFSSVIYASSPPAKDDYICQVLDYHQLPRLRARDSLSVATKQALNLNVGEPRTVRMIYFLPNDWSYRIEVVDSMKTVIRQVQTFYGEQMQVHGYGNKTFRFETDAQGEPLVHRVDGQHPFSYYDNTLGTRVVAELEQTFDLDVNIYVIVLGTDALRQGDGQPAGGVGWWRTKNGGALVVPDDFSFFTVAHELGHTFGLKHDFRDNSYIMSYGSNQKSQLSACAAEFLSVHTFFNPDSPIEEGQPPTRDAGYNVRFDLDGDGVIGIGDFLIFVDNFGKKVS